MIDVLAEAVEIRQTTVYNGPIVSICTSFIPEFVEVAVALL